MEEGLSHEDRLHLADAFLSRSRAYFFQASPNHFRKLLDFFVTGQLCLPPEEACFDGVRQLWLVWDIKPLHPSEQTAHSESRRMSSLFAARSSLHSIHAVIGVGGAESVEAAEEEAQWAGIRGGLRRRRLWTALEQPESSRVGKFYNLLSATFVLTSLFILIFGSLRAFQVEDESGQWRPHLFLEWTEVVCIIWFSKEYLLRWLVTPQKSVLSPTQGILQPAAQNLCRKAFMKDGQNVVDVLSILPFYVELLLTLSGVRMENLQDIQVRLGTG